MYPGTGSILQATNPGSGLVLFFPPPSLPPAQLSQMWNHPGTTGKMRIFYMEMILDSGWRCLSCSDVAPVKRRQQDSLHTLDIFVWMGRVSLQQEPCDFSRYKSWFFQVQILIFRGANPDFSVAGVGNEAVRGQSCRAEGGGGWSWCPTAPGKHSHPTGRVLSPWDFSFPVSAQGKEMGINKNEWREGGKDLHKLYQLLFWRPRGSSWLDWSSPSKYLAQILAKCRQNCTDLAGPSWETRIWSFSEGAVLTWRGLLSDMRHNSCLCGL